MHKPAYILPIAAILTYYLIDGNDEYWWLYPLLAVICEVLLYVALHHVSKVKEYLSGYVVAVEHHFPWTEMRTYTVTVSRNGRTHTEVRHAYIRHPDEWFRILNTGVTINTDYLYYRNTAAQWATTPFHIDPPHISCVSGGGGERCNWNNIEADTDTVTYTGRYSNYVQNSNSIFKQTAISRKTATELGLIDYPEITRSEQDVVCVSSHLKGNIDITPGIQEKFQRINAFCGAKHQIHIFILLFDARQGIDIAGKQRAYWKGGNKNEFTVCIGLDGNTVSWCKPFSWMDAPTLEVAAQQYFIEHSELNLEAFAEWLRQNLTLWKRKEFSDFKYLGIHLSKNQTIAFYAIAAVLSAISIAIIHHTTEDRTGTAHYYETETYQFTDI